MMAEEICQKDGSSKNDCERNAAKRLLHTMRRHHPHLPITVVEDGLYANGPHIEQLQLLNMSYIITAKPNDHAYLFEWVKYAEAQEYVRTKAKIKHRYRFVNEAPLNESREEMKVNFLEYWEEGSKQTKHFTWVTSFQITSSNMEQIMRGGRARWRIENETFNTLKNQGYHFNHNFILLPIKERMFLREFCKLIKQSRSVV